MSKGKLVSEYTDSDEAAPTRVTVHKIENGYVVEAFCGSKEKAEFIKKLSKVPSTLARLFKITKEDRDAISKNTKVEESESEEKDGKVSVKIKMTR